MPSIEHSAVGREDEAALVTDLLFTHAVLAGAPRQASAAVLAPLAVLPEFQRQRADRALIEHGASLLATSGVELLSVLGQPAYYTLRGFVPAIPHGLRAPHPIVPEEASMVRPLPPDVLGSVTGVMACAESMAKPDYWREKLSSCQATAVTPNPSLKPTRTGVPLAAQLERQASQATLAVTRCQEAPCPSFA